MSRRPSGQTLVTPTRAPSAILALAAMVATALVVMHPDRVTLDGALCAGLALVLCLLPLARHCGGNSSGRLPILALFGLFHAVFLVLPVFMIDLVWPDGTPIRIYSAAPEVTGYGIRVTGIVLSGVAAMLAGMALARHIPGVPVLPMGEETGHGLRRAMWAMLAFHFSYYAFPLLSSVPTLGQLVKPTGILAFGLAFAALQAKRLTLVETMVVFGVLLPLRLVIGAKDGALFDSLLLVTAMVMMAVTLWPRVIFLLAPLLLAAALFYGPVQLARHVLYKTSSPSGKVEVLAGMIQDYIANSDRLTLPYKDKNLAKALYWPLAKRIDQVTVLAVVIDSTPSKVEPWGGKTLRPLLTGIIPRALWPGKPEERAGAEFGFRFGLLHPWEHKMSVNMPWLTEFYANFLLPGVVIGMATVGLVLGLLDRLLNPGGGFGARTALAATLLVPLTLPESNLSLMTSNLPTISLALWGMLWLLLRRWRPAK